MKENIVISIIVFSVFFMGEALGYHLKVSKTETTYKEVSIIKEKKECDDAGGTFSMVPYHKDRGEYTIKCTKTTKEELLNVTI